MYLARLNAGNFRERMKIRHRIEEQNGELKETHGLRSKGDLSFCMLSSIFVYRSGFYDRRKKTPAIKWEFFSALVNQNPRDFFQPAGDGT